MGLLWAILAETPYVMFTTWIKPTRWMFESIYVIGAEVVTKKGYNMWTRLAFESMAFGSQALFGILALMWLLAYIQSPNLQEAYFKAMHVGSWISYALVAWVLTAFIVGGIDVNEVYYDNALGFNIMYGCIFAVAVIGFELIAAYAFGEGAMKYYKWDEQEWWNHEEDMEEINMM